MDTPDSWADSVADNLLASGAVDLSTSALLTALIEQLQEHLPAVPAAQQPACLAQLEQRLLAVLMEAEAAGPAPSRRVTPDRPAAGAAAPVPAFSAAPAPAAAAGAEIPADLARRIGFRENTPIAPDRAAFLAVQGLKFILTLEQLVWTVWKNIAPTSRIRRESKDSPSLPKVLFEYLRPGSTKTPEASEQALEKTRQLAAGLLGALGPIGRTYGRRTAQKFAPANILDVVRREGARAGLLGGLDVKCWKKYNVLVQDLHEDVIEKEIHEAIANYTEDLLRSSKF